MRLHHNVQPVLELWLRSGRCSKIAIDSLVFHMRFLKYVSRCFKGRFGPTSTRSTAWWRYLFNNVKVQTSECAGVGARGELWIGSGYATVVYLHYMYVEYKSVSRKNRCPKFSSQVCVQCLRACAYSQKACQACDPTARFPGGLMLNFQT